METLTNSDDRNRSINYDDCEAKNIVAYNPNLQSLPQSSYQNNFKNPANRKLMDSKENLITASNCCCIQFFNFLMFAGGITAIVLIAVSRLSPAVIAMFSVIASIITIASLCMCCGCVVLDPNQGVVVQFCGVYKGTIKDNGCIYVIPCFGVKKISYKSNNFESEILKINDKKGNPIEIGAVITWKIYDSYKATYDISDLFGFVRTQSESAIRTLATRYPYDKMTDNEICLKDGSEHIHHEFIDILQQNLDRAGVYVEEAKFNHMAYAKEIAETMLKRQQAESIIAAREKIIQGAVGLVGMAIESLKQNNINGELSREERVTIASNLLVVLCSESHSNHQVSTSVKDQSKAHHIKKLSKKVTNLNQFGSNAYMGNYLQEQGIQWNNYDINN